MGGGGERGHRSAHAARQPDRCLHGGDVPRLRLAARGDPRGADGPCGQRQRGQCVLGPGGVHPRPAGRGGHLGHRVFVVAGGDAPGGRITAAARVHPGAGRWRRHHVHRERVPGGLQSAPAVPRCPVPVVRGRRRRNGVRGGRRAGTAGTAVGRTAGRPSGAGRDPRLGDQPGRRQHRHGRAERARPAAADPRRAEGRAAVGGGRGRGGGAWHRYRVRRLHRAPGAARHIRPGPSGEPAAAAGIGQVEHRSHPGRRRDRRCDQDGDGDAPGRAAAFAPHRPADPAGVLAHGCGAAADRADGLAPRGAAAPGRCVVVQRERHQRPCDSGGVHRAGGGRPRRRGRPRPGGGAVGAVRAVPGGAARPGPCAGRAHGGGRSGALPLDVRCGLVAGDHAVGVRPPGGRDRPGAGGAEGGAARGGGR